MDPKLVCKIEVQTSANETSIGSGYPIARNRIITAAHVIAGAAVAESNALRIKLFFAATAKTVEGRGSIEWDGRPAGIDVAVLRCELPADLQPAPKLLETPPSTPIAWFAQGYTEFGEQKRPGGKDDYRGQLTKFADTESTVALGCVDGPVTSEQWAGGSGSVAFDSETAKTALAVITRYQGGKKDDQLIAVPICYLLNSAATKAGFSQAIRFDLYRQQEKHRNYVINVVASKLKILGGQFRDLAKTIWRLLEEDTSWTGDGKTEEALAHDLADYIVNRWAINEVVGVLVGLMDELPQDQVSCLADITDHLLPLNYAPHVNLRLREQSTGEMFGLVENEVATSTLAEVIMAGYDQQSAKFAKFRDHENRVRGRTALVYGDGPEEGPGGAASSEASTLLRETRNFLYDLLALKDEILKEQKTSGYRSAPDVRNPENLKQEIESYASRLRGPLTAISRMSQGRTVYCVLTLPMESQQREFRKKVLGEVRQRVPQLVFVELMPDPADERELEVEAYIQVRLIRTQ